MLSSFTLNVSGWFGPRTGSYANNVLLYSSDWPSCVQEVGGAWWVYGVDVHCGTLKLAMPLQDVTGTFQDRCQRFLQLSGCKAKAAIAPCLQGGPRAPGETVWVGGT